MWLHCKEAHGGEIVEFTSKLIRRHRTPLTRQVHEFVAISKSKCKFTLNRKDDWNACKSPRLVVEVSGVVVDEKGPKRGPDEDPSNQMSPTKKMRSEEKAEGTIAEPRPVKLPGQGIER